MWYKVLVFPEAGELISLVIYASERDTYFGWISRDGGKQLPGAGAAGLM